jgi:hypothetical protein
MSSKLICPAKIVAETIDHLRAAGCLQRECIVFWLGRNGAESIGILEARRPRHTAWRDRFQIPPDEMTDLKDYLCENRYMIAAQIHSHPAEAYHSHADDIGAVIRHLGALSFVIPRFAGETTVSSFLGEAAVFELRQGNRWTRLPYSQVSTKCQIVL